MFESLVSNNKLIGCKMVIATLDGKTVLGTSQGSTANNRAVVSFDMTATAPDPESDLNVCVLEIVKGYNDSSYALKDIRSNTYLCLPSNNNYLTFSDSVYAGTSWDITFTSDIVKLTSQWNPDYVIQKSKTDDFISCFTGAQNDIAIYIYAEKA